MVPWGLGLGKRRELFRPCRASSVAQPLIFFSVFSKTIRCERASIKNASGRPKPAAFLKDRLLALLGSRIPRHMRLFTG